MQLDHKKIIDIEENPDTALMNAVELFHSGKIFIYPTDTIYGIGGNPFDEAAVDRILKIKVRDESKKFIWLLSDFENVMNYADIIFESHVEFLSKIWPAPVTVILNLNRRTNEILKQETVAIRIPDNDFCLKLLKEISRPLISTSVNRSGQKPSNKIEIIQEKFSRDVDLILFDRTNFENQSSTIIDLTAEKPRLVREGSAKFVELLQKLS